MDLQREDRFLRLAGEGPVRGQVEDLDVLLGDRGGALGVAALGVVERRPDDALGVEAAVGPEGAVLGGDHRVLHVGRDVGERDVGAVLLGELAEHRLAVGVVDVGGLGLEPLVGRGDVHPGVGVGEQRQADQRRPPHRPGRAGGTTAATRSTTCPGDDPSSRHGPPRRSAACRSGPEAALLAGAFGCLRCPLTGALSVKGLPEGSLRRSSATGCPVRGARHSRVRGRPDHTGPATD